MIKVLFVFGFVAVIAGCESTSRFGDEAKAGGAVYFYESTESADGTKKCSVNGTSAKEVPGVKIKISSECDLEVEATASSPVGDAFSAIREMAEKMPDMSVLP